MKRMNSYIPPIYVRGLSCTFELFTFTNILPKVIALKSNPKIMCNMPMVAPILVTDFADPELWAQFHLMKFGTCSS